MPYQITIESERRTFKEQAAKDWEQILLCRAAEMKNGKYFNFRSNRGFICMTEIDRSKITNAFASFTLKRNSLKMKISLL